MFNQRPNPFTSFEGCLLSQTLWGVMVLIGFFGGAFLGRELGDSMQGTGLGALTGIWLLGFTPWRRWLVRFLQRHQRPSHWPEPGDDPDAAGTPAKPKR